MKQNVCLENFNFSNYITRSVSSEMNLKFRALEYWEIIFRNTSATFFYFPKLKTTKRYDII